jgi:pilus assembly protein Flp/PilA
MNQLAKLLSFARRARRHAADESGATSIEYAMIASGIAVMIAAAIPLLGTKVADMFTAAKNLF